jgi:hypothetical protein
MTAPQAPSAELADATRTAIAMCAASHRGDMDGWAQLVNSTPPPALIAAFTGVVRFLADRLASDHAVRVEDIYTAILFDLSRRAQ